MTELRSNEITAGLAKMLAHENINIRFSPHLKTAFSDLKTRTLLLPVWIGVSQDVVDMLIVHESGHFLDTPREKWKESIDNICFRIYGNKNNVNVARVRSFLNIVEDVRIDKRAKRRWPGARKNYVQAYKELHNRDFFGTNGKNVNGLLFIDRANIYFKGGSFLNIQFSPVEKAFLRKIGETETFEEVVYLTEMLIRRSKEDLKSLSDDMNMLDEEHGNIVSEIDGNDDSDYEDDFSDYEKEDIFSKDHSELESAEGKGSENSEDDGEDNEGKGSEDVEGENEPLPETDEAWEKSTGNITSVSDIEYIYLKPPVINYNIPFYDPYKRVLSEMGKQFAPGKMTAVYKGQKLGYVSEYHKDNLDITRKEFHEWRKKENDNISFLVKEFETRKAAETYSRSLVAKTGTLNSSKLYAYKTVEDIFKRITVVPEGKNHGFIFFLDWSGSMFPNMIDTTKQLISLVLFCKRVGVPFEVYSFLTCRDKNACPYDRDSSDIRASSPRIRQLLTSSMKPAEMDEMFGYLWYNANNRNGLESDYMSSTPLDGTLLLAPKMVNDFRKRYRLTVVNTIILTDGDSDTTTLHQSVSSFSLHKKEFFYTDPDTKKVYKMERGGWGRYDGNHITSTLLQILKDKTDCNLIGFFLAPPQFNYISARFGFAKLDGNYVLGLRKMWNNQNFIPVQGQGYDQYFVIKNGKIEEGNLQDLSVNTTKQGKISINKLSKDFAKLNRSKKSNRTLLTRFIDNVIEAS